MELTMMIFAVVLSVGVGLLGAGAILLAVLSLLFKYSVRIEADDADGRAPRVIYEKGPLLKARTLPAA
jgi:hypothetical protein